MEMLGMKKHLVFAGILVLASLGAQAEDIAFEGWYAGGTLGVTSVDDDGAFDFDGPFGASSFDDNDGGWGFFGGYRFNDHFAVEGRWNELGEYRVSIPLSTTDTVEAKAFSFHLVGLLPLNDKWELTAGLGVASVDTNCPGCSTEDGIVIGIGATYRTSPNMSFFFGFDRYAFEDDAGSGTEFDFEIDLTQIGLRYNFE
jgi:OOP family OmpA-OmpF porin